MTTASEQEKKASVCGSVHEHEHSSIPFSGSKLIGVTVLNAFITALEIVGGLLSGSLSLLSDAVHNLSDTLSIVLTYMAWKIAGRKKTSAKPTGISGRKFLLRLSTQPRRLSFPFSWKPTSI